MDAETAPLLLRHDEWDDPTRVFVAKEATYKAWWVRTQRSLEPEDVRISFDPGDRFHAALKSGEVLEGRSVAAAGRWIACVVVGRDG